MWKLFFTLFAVSWVIPSSVRETLLGWNGSFVGKKHRTVWKKGPLCLFWSVWKARNKIVFEDGVLSIQRLKASFIYLLWSETKLFIKKVLDVNWFHWLGGFPLREGLFFVYLVGQFFFLAARGWVSLSCTSWAANLAPLCNTIVLLIKKKITSKLKKIWVLRAHWSLGLLNYFFFW